MSRIVCGMFDETVRADAALAELARKGFAKADIDTFYVSPPGQNAVQSVGGDAPHSSEGSRHAGVGAGIGAGVGLVVGLAAGAVGAIDLGAPTIPLAGGLGALIGSIAGAFSTVRDGRRSAATREHPVEMRGGRMVAVCVDRSGTEAQALEALRGNGARDVRRAEGEWRNGWRDFDPRSPLAAI
jgi:hypothetical protein